MNILSSSYYHKYYLQQLRKRLSAQGAKFLFYRKFRYTITEKVDSFFDQLARMKHISGTRIDSEEFVWTNGFTLGHASAFEGEPFSQCFVRVWADSIEVIRDVEKALLDNIGSLCVQEPTFILDWHFLAEGAIASTEIEALVTGALLDNAYLALGAKPADFVRAFLESSASVLVLQGPPGTGKTRLIRHILGEMSRIKLDKAKAIYTSDDGLLRDDQLFVRFLTNQYDAFVVEDADHLLGSRAHGNVDLHRFLNIADGIIRAKHKKLIFSTNLPNLRDIDEAIVRPGRCFAHVKLDLLGKEQAVKCLEELRLSSEQQTAFHEKFPAQNTVSLASLYAFVERARKPENALHLKVA